ncbi:DUF6978 family protein [Fulvivirga sediminis]|uniref:Uncharacterized protein n=1 Tax=Fulvivirga sediminis TaxID=2803949 RepID=A0A937F694_9BACT|nr:hypothetical protein [Fulvivirga sediminis]MBL3655080.1 hypothetical protein [Fulvivirga sediminis]
MELNPSEVKTLFDVAKYPCYSASVEFPTQGEYLEIELQNDTGRIKFQSDISRKNKIVNKATLQLRYKKTYIIRRLDFMGNHTNPPAPAPDKIFYGFEEYVCLREDHIHFYMDGFGERWALPLSKVPEIGITKEDDLYEKMIKFFTYCKVEDLRVKVVKNLIF